jgi:uncharacterized protein (TIGR02611 family)
MAFGCHHSLYSEERNPLTGWISRVILAGDVKDVPENLAVTPERTHASQEAAGQKPVVAARRRVAGLRRRILANPGSRHVYRIVVAVVGAAVTLGGLILVPLPGPGWLIVFVGLAILASEFTWAQRLLDLGRHWLSVWTRWLGRQVLWVRCAVGLATVGFVCLIVYGMAVLWGVPAWVPDSLVPPLPGL